MSKQIKIHHEATALLAVVLIAGVVGVSLFSGLATNYSDGSAGASGNFEASVLKIKRKVARKISEKILTELLAESADDEATADGALICSYAAPKNPQYKAEFLAQHTQAATEQGGETEVTLYLRNDGDVPWFSDNSGCGTENYMRIGTARARDHGSVFYNPGDKRWLGQNRIAMVESRVDPGKIATFTFSAKLPRVDDVFREYYQPIVEGRQWLERAEETANVDIYVGANDEEDENKLKYLRISGQLSAFDMSGNPVIHVDISEQKVQLKFRDTVVREYVASTGTFRTPTPMGRFKILLKQDLRIGNKYPHYRMPEFQMITPGGVGFHALPYLANDRGVFWNEALSHLGRPVSHGCIRLSNADAQELFELTDIGMEVVIHA